MDPFTWVLHTVALNGLWATLISTVRERERGGAWEQGGVRLHLHLDEQKEEKWAGECEHNFLRFYCHTLTPAVNIRLLITRL